VRQVNQKIANKSSGTRPNGSFNWRLNQSAGQHRIMSDEVPNNALRAYQLWDAAGRPEGRSEEFYFQAEEEFRKMLEAPKDTE
jgi:DUF2934 family protein